MAAAIERMVQAVKRMVTAKILRLERLGVGLLATLAVFILMTTVGCQKTPKQAERKTCTYSGQGEDITAYLKDGPVTLLEKDGRTLILDETGVLSVEEDGKELWCSAIKDPQMLAGLGDTDSARSVAVAHYQTDRTSDQTMSTYGDSLLKGQYRIYREDSCVRIEHILGDFSEDILLPEAVEKERFEALLLSMEDTDARFVERQYALYTPEEAQLKENAEILETVPGLKEKAFYVLLPLESQQRKQRIQDLLMESGYTAADLEADRQAAGISETDPGNVFKIVLEFWLEEDGLVMNVPCDQLYSPEDTPLLRLDFLKYGWYVAENSLGYYMVPAGSGSLFRFTAGKKVDIWVRTSSICGYAI